MSSSPRPPSLDPLLSACTSAGGLGLLVDFDGTLSEIVPRPTDATARPGSIAALQSLVRSDVAVAIVSGRKLEDLVPRVGLEDVWFAGQHGGELQDPRGQRVELVSPKAGRPLLERFLKHARAVAAPRELLVEDKGLAVAVHTRGLEANETREVMHTLWREARELSAGGALVWQTGKQVVELRARGADKGRAAEHLLAQWKRKSFLAIGDDTTDEDMFAVVARRGGLAVKVGPGPTAAKHRLESPEALEVFLVELARQCHENENSAPLA